MRTDTYDTIENLWPLTCVYCGSDSVILLQADGNAICEECGRYQIEEEE